MWVQLGEKPCNSNKMLLEIARQLQVEMENIRVDNEKMRMKKERMLKILSDRKNQRNPDPSPKDETELETHH